MSRGRQYIQFEGYFAENVLGIFRVIRGFADLRDLAAVSVPYEMTDHETEAQRVIGHQRELNEKHALDIKKYLEQSDNRFLPEVVLSCRVPVNPIDWDQRVVLETDEPPGSVIGVQDDENTPIAIRRRYNSKTTRIQTIRISRQNLDQVKTDKLIRRIDGNHRLALAEQLHNDPTVPTKFLAPFCLVLLGAVENQADDYAESLIFHTINNTALPLESEHGLRLLLGQDSAYDMTPENEFNYSPELYLTRLLSVKLQGLPQPAQERFGERPLTVLWETARNLIAVDEAIVESRTALEAFANDLFAGLSDIMVRLTVNHPSLCKTYSFLELAARIWRESGGTHEERVNMSVQTLDRIGRWLGSEGITGLLNPVSPAQQLLTTFNAAQNRIPRKVFLARWYPPADAPDDAFNKANLRLGQLRQTLEHFQRDYGIALELIDMGTEEGGTFPIHQKMYEAIAASEIIICDLTGHRPNVYVEAGYALKHHEQSRLIYLFEPQNADDRVPFDLNTFKYVQVSQAAEIPGRLTPEIKAILEDAGAVLEGGTV
jgi:hypothetical protein